jgi:PIN domain nuclease of toxin-antitoxin system
VRLLLDTCTFLWVITDSPRLSAHALELFRSPDHEAFLSAASAWEISTKHSLGRLRLPQSPERFIPAMREHHGIDALAIDEESVLQTIRLPALHRDPFDRLLVCQAIVHGLTLLTPDPHLAISSTCRLVTTAFSQGCSLAFSGPRAAGLPPPRLCGFGELRRSSRGHWSERRRESDGAGDPIHRQCGAFRRAKIACSWRTPSVREAGPGCRM